MDEKIFKKLGEALKVINESSNNDYRTQATKVNFTIINTSL
jgi:hypothetical protein